MNHRIGVIVPVYKTEKYVAECIESILAQTYTNLRLILVDDGSPDNAGKICDEYAKKDSRITVIHQENAGVTRARAIGVEAADDCEWITFVDSDDTITKDALEQLYSCTNNKTDIVLSIVDEYINNYTTRMPNSEYRTLVVSNTSFVDTPWGKLIRRNIFNDFVFDIPSWFKVHEDSLMNIRLAFNTTKDVEICPKHIYIYKENNESVTHSFKKDINYEQLYHEYRMLSIPEKERDFYIKCTIKTRFTRSKVFIFYKYNIVDFTSTKFYKNLKKDIEDCKYKLGIIDKILFYCTSPIIRILFVNIKKTQNLFNRYFN